MLNKQKNILIVVFSLFLQFLFQHPLLAKAGLDYCYGVSYDSYKKDFLSPRGRIKDPERNDITVSEAQGYMLLRSVLMNDQKTFNLVYKWTKDKLQRKDRLFSWLWGPDKTGKYKILDYNSASDADVNIAFALILANERWKNNKYLKEAMPIIHSIWIRETRQIGKHRVLMPGFEQTKSLKIEINPSYFSPFAFKLFAKYDKKHNWNSLVESSYYYIKASSAMTKTGLPPNWFLIKNGKIVLEDSSRSDFSYDAVRVFKKIYLDYLRTGDTRDLPILAKSKFFISKWKTSKHFYTNYKKDGTLRDPNEYIGSISILIPPIAIYDKKVATEIYKKNVYSYFLNRNKWGFRNDYYAKNLLWFGCHFYYNSSSQNLQMVELYKQMFKGNAKIY